MSSNQIVSKPQYGSAIGMAENLPIPLDPAFQTFFDDIEGKLNTNLLGEAVMLPIYAVADLPDATLYTGGQVFVSDETGGAVTAFSDGTDWLRSTDRTIVS